MINFVKAYNVFYLKVTVIIPASGSGERFGGKVPKQFLKVKGREVIAHTIAKFTRIRKVDEIIISTKPEYFVRMGMIVRKNNFKKVKRITEGGERRQDSVYNALLQTDGKDDSIILIHDAVRPFITEKKIREVIKAAEKNVCVITGLRISETIKRTDKNDFVTETINRTNVRAIQTPQAFRKNILMRSFEKAYEENFTGTDEAAIVEHAGFKVKVIDGEKTNIKITHKEDLK